MSKIEATIWTSFQHFWKDSCKQISDFLSLVNIYKKNFDRSAGPRQYAQHTIRCRRGGRTSLVGTLPSRSRELKVTIMKGTKGLTTRPMQDHRLKQLRQQYVKQIAERKPYQSRETVCMPCLHSNVIGCNTAWSRHLKRMQKMRQEGSKRKVFRFQRTSLKLRTSRNAAMKKVWSRLKSCKGFNPSESKEMKQYYYSIGLRTNSLEQRPGQSDQRARSTNSRGLAVRKSSGT